MAQRRRKIRRRYPQSRQRRKQTLMIRAVFFIIVVAGITASFLLWRKYSPTKERADLNKYYGITDENQLAIIVDNKVLEPKGMLSDGKAYVEYEFVRDYINDRFYWDSNENILLYTLPDDMVSVEVGSKDYMISKKKKSESYVILKTDGNVAYIALDFVKQYTDMDYEVYNNPSRVMIETETEVKTAVIKRDTQVRYQGGIKSPILTDIGKKEEVRVVEDEGDWKKIRTEDGFIGYVKKRLLKKEMARTVQRAFKEPKYTGISRDHTISMAWHNVTNAEANSGVLEMIARTKGLNTIAPTWFHVKDVKGNLESIASVDYVNYAHRSDIEVWGAVRDFDGGISSFEESYDLLSRTSNRENLIHQLIAEALRTGLDGINVDFEKISAECGEHYIQFIRELSVKCRQNELVLSVDNYVPAAHNQQYHRKEQGVMADYVIIMGYDEHYAGSFEAGPVASYDFVREGIKRTLKEVPEEKVINGVPFFTRVWKETPKSPEELKQQKGTEKGEYPMKVESAAYGMEDAAAIVAQAGVEIEWDEDVKQNYAAWEDEGSTYEVWLEDEDSLEPRLELMKDYNLAGIAAWRLGLEKSGIWEMILKYVN